MRSLGIILISLAVLIPALAAAIVASAGVTGYQMDTINDADEQAVWLEMDDLDSIVGNGTAERLGMVYGTLTAPLDPASGEPLPETFVFVPDDHIHETVWGHTLIHVPRSAGEEFLQARSLRNISWLAAAGLFGLGLLLVTISLWRGRRAREVA